MRLRKFAVRIRTALTNTYTFYNRTRLMFQRVSAFYLRICLFLKWVNTFYTEIMYIFVKRVFAFCLIRVCFYCTMTRQTLQRIFIFHTKAKLVVSKVLTIYMNVMLTMKYLSLSLMPVFFLNILLQRVSQNLRNMIIIELNVSLYLYLSTRITLQAVFALYETTSTLLEECTHSVLKRLCIYSKDKTK